MGKVHVNKGRVALALIAVVVSMTVVDSVRREFFKVNTSSKVTVHGDFITKSASAMADDNTVPFTLDENGQPTTEFNGVRFVGKTEQQITSDKLGQGLLVLADAEHPVAEGSRSDMIDLLGCKNDSYTLIEEGVMLNSDAAEALNNMMIAYENATGLNDFIVYGTTDTYTGQGSFCPKAFAERATGNTVDLALNGCGSVIAFDGYDEEGWVLENCAKYGRLYKFESGVESSITSVCPEGWHIPDSLEFVELISYVSRHNGGEPVGVSLKATTDWYVVGDTVFIPGDGEIARMDAGSIPAMPILLFSSFPEKPSSRRMLPSGP